MRFVIDTNSVLRVGFLMAENSLVEAFGAVVAVTGSNGGLLADSLHNVTRQKAVEAFGSSRSEFEALELETTLWDLVCRLNNFRDGCSSQFSFKKTPSSVSSTFTITQCVIGWVQSNLTRPTEPANLQSIKWMYTASQRRKRGSKFCTELDLDAPLREGLSIAEEDWSCDEVLHKYVFELLLAGEHAAARTACADTSNWLLLAALDASAPSASAELACSSLKLLPTQIAEACIVLSNSSQLSRYERGVYGLLGRNLAAIKSLCESWETLLLAHLLCDASLENFERNIALDHKLILQSSDWRRIIALALIQDRFPELVQQLVVDVQENTAQCSIVQHTWLVRILLHVQLALDLRPNPVLVQIYIEYLCEDPNLLDSRLDLVPAYVRFLEGENQANVYGRVLAQITDLSVQSQQVKLVERYGIALAGPIKIALSLNFDLYVEDQQEQACERLVGILNWPVAAQQWSLAANALVRAYILFLQHSSRHGIVLLSEQVSARLVRDRAMDEVRARIHEYPTVVADLAQLEQYFLLGNALDALSRWNQAKFCAYSGRSAASKFIGNALDAVTAALNFGEPHSSHIHYTQDVQSTMEQIRKVYIPMIVYELFGILQDAQSVSSGYANLALQFAVKLADEELKLYELFDERLMASLVKPALSNLVSSGLANAVY